MPKVCADALALTDRDQKSGAARNTSIEGYSLGALHHDVLVQGNVQAGMCYIQR